MPPILNHAGILKGSASIGAASTLERLDWHSTLEHGTSFLNLMAVIWIQMPGFAPYFGTVQILEKWVYTLTAAHSALL